MSEEDKKEGKEDKKEEIPEENLPVYLGRCVGGLFANKLFADVHFVVGTGEAEKTFPAHRLILAAASPLFECMLYPRDDKGDSVLPLTKSPIVVKLPGVDPVGFEVILKCIYTDELDVTAGNIQSLLNLSSKYQVEKVQAACTDFMEGDITKDNVLDLFQIAPKMLGDEDFGVSFIEQNASDVLATDGFSRLSEDRMLKIIQNESLSCEEIEVFKAVVSWGKVHFSKAKETKEGETKEGDSKGDSKEEDSKGEKEEFKKYMQTYLKHVRFPTMDMNDIAAVVGPSGLVQESDLLSLFSYISVTDENIRALLPAPNFKTEPRSGGKKAKFSTINDNNGFIYFLGTDGGKQTYTNPHTSGAASVSISTNGGASLDHIFDRVPTAYAVRSSYGDSSPWISVTFSKYVLRPTEIVICQEYNHILRNWRLEGKERGKYEWITIGEWKDDRTLMDKSPKQACFPLKTTKWFQTLRIWHTGPNGGGTNDLEILQLEFYGYYKAI